MPKTRKTRPVSKSTSARVKRARARVNGRTKSRLKVRLADTLRSRDTQLAKASATTSDAGKSLSSRWLKFTGSALLRHKLIFATMMHRPVEISHIREDGGGLKDFEMTLIEILDKITNGSIFEINETGTCLRYKPGSIVGNSRSLSIECPTSRGLTYWIEPLLLLLPFAREQSSVVLKGATYHALDVSLDVIRGVLLPILKREFGMTEVRIDATRRGVAPLGGGEVLVSVPLLKELRSVHLLDVGMIKKVRGLCYTVAMAPTVANRVRVACNEQLYHFISDVWLFNDRTTRSEVQKATGNKDVSAGYGLTLIAESTSGVLLSASKQATDSSQTAEEFGKEVSRLLLEEVSFGGTVDTCLQATIVTLMALSVADVSRVRLGRLTPHTVAVLRLIRAALGVTFKLKEDPVTGTLFGSCLGIGYRNVWRQAT